MTTPKIFKKIALAIFVSLSLSALPSLASPPERAVGYWTEAAMKSARPISMVVDSKTGVGVRSLEPMVGNTLGSDWDTDGVPQKAVGKVFFSIGLGDYVCSGSVIQDENPSISIVVTAAHCAMDAGRFVTNWAFVPDYETDGFNPTQNVWYARNLVVRAEVASSKSFNKNFIEHDWAFAVIPVGEFTKNNVLFTNPPSHLDSVGAFTYSQTGFTSLGQIATAFGYPAAYPYNGGILKYAQGAIKRDPFKYASWGMPSDLTGGASGGPWLSSLELGQVSSVNSYKYNNDSLSMYGPKFNSKTTATFQAAKAATGSSDVIVRR